MRKINSLFLIDYLFDSQKNENLVGLLFWRDVLMELKFDLISLKCQLEIRASLNSDSKEMKNKFKIFCL